MPSIARTLVIAAGTLVAAGLLAGIVGVIAIFTGAIPVSAIPAHGRLEAAVLHTAFKNAVAASADAEPPEDLGAPGRVRLGANHYANTCAKCHGGPDLGQNPIALSMRPRPQHLPTVVDQFDDDELFWIVKNGVRFSAMPAWPTLERDEEIWSVVSFLRRLPDLSAQEYAELTTMEPGLGPTIPYSAVAARQIEIPWNSGNPDEQYYAVPSTEWADIAMPGHPVQRCATCHGRDGTGAPTEGRAPNLTIQSDTYLERTLTAYAEGRRHSGYMQPLAADLSPQQISRLADYYADMPATPSDAPSSNPETMELGRSVALAGASDRTIPGCLTCHERDVTTGSIVIPNLFGQADTYISDQLHAFADGGRGGAGVYNPMHEIARDLTDDEVEAVSTWLARQEPGAPRPERQLAGAEAVDAAGTFDRVCSECHTNDATGSDSGRIPNLTLQTPIYIEHRLYRYREGLRHANQMNQVSLQLSDAEIQALSRHVGEMESEPGDGEPPEEGDDRLVLGGAIAREGLPDRGVPACLSCHGEETTSALPLIARIQGQHEQYLHNRLEYFASETAQEESDINPMPEIAPELTEDERAAVAAWFAAQPIPRREARAEP